MRISDWSSDVCSSDLRVIRSAIANMTRCAPSTKAFQQLSDFKRFSDDRLGRLSDDSTLITLDADKPFDRQEPYCLAFRATSDAKPLPEIACHKPSSSSALSTVNTGYEARRVATAAGSTCRCRWSSAD